MATKNIALMEMTLSLCMNCENAPGCTLRNGHSVMFCEEHQVANWKLVKSGLNLKQGIGTEPASLEHFKGLCSDCELKESCTWRNPETVVFHCEHYL